MGSICGNRLGGSETSLETGRRRFDPDSTRPTGPYSGSDRGVGGPTAFPVQRPADRRRSGAIAWRVGIYAAEVPAPGLISSVPDHFGAFPPGPPSFRLK